MGLEPMTSPLPRECSTTELQEHFRAVAGAPVAAPEGPEIKFLERAKGFEPSTSTLARLRSTSELPPRNSGTGYGN